MLKLYEHVLLYLEHREIPAAICNYTVMICGPLVLGLQFNAH
jgi:hypothetical protein